MSLVIRQEQMAALQFDLDVRWYESQLMPLYPGFAEASAKDRRQWIRGALKRAASFQINRADSFQFLCFEQTFSEGCWEQADFEWARRILTDPAKSSADRVKRLRQEAIRHLLVLEEAAQ
jgi:hypothetical protein